MKTFEWPTLAVLVSTYAVWAAATGWLASVNLPASIALTAVAIAQFSSLQHEMIHGHPFRDSRLNAALVSPALSLVIPYLRFRDTHLDHHRDSDLTDPFDDPESNYLDLAGWEKLSGPRKAIRNVNNTLAGRLLLGPLLGTLTFVRNDIRQARRNPEVVRGWLWHIPALAPVLFWIDASAMPFSAYFIACYGGLSLLRIRTFLEHQAHESARARTVIIEDRGPLALLFLNNNFHIVHHMHPSVPWYRLPALYSRNRGLFLDQNGGYRYRSYGEIFRRYFFTRKDPVAHPIWRRG